jgi:hypothetical protein
MAGPKPKVTTDEVLAVFEENDDSCEPFNAPEIAEMLRYDCHRNTARNYLQDLVALGELRTKKVGGGSRVYWRPCRNSDEQTG